MRKSLVAACAVLVAAGGCYKGSNPRSDAGQAAASQAPAQIAPESTEVGAGSGDFDQRAIQQWIGQLEGAADPEARQQAVDALAGMGSSRESVVQALIFALGDQIDAVRNRSRDALTRYGTGITGALVGALQDHPDENVRAGVASVLGNLVPADSPVRALGASLLRDPSPAVRRASADALAVRGDRARRVPGLLVRSLDQDPDPDVRRASAVALGKIGPSASEAIPALQEAMDDNDRNVASAAAISLRQIRQ